MTDKSDRHETLNLMAVAQGQGGFWITAEGHYMPVHGPAQHYETLFYAGLKSYERAYARGMIRVSFFSGQSFDINYGRAATTKALRALLTLIRSPLNPYTASFMVETPAACRLFNRFTEAETKVAPIDAAYRMVMQDLLVANVKEKGAAGRRSSAAVEGWVTRRANLAKAFAAKGPITYYSPVTPGLLEEH